MGAIIIKSHCVRIAIKRKEKQIRSIKDIVNKFLDDFRIEIGNLAIDKKENFS